MNYMRKVNGVWKSTVTLFGDNGSEPICEATQEEDTDRTTWERPIHHVNLKSGSSKRRARKAAYNLRRAQCKV